MKVTPLPLALCLSVLIHGGIAAAVFSFRQAASLNRAPLAQTPALAIEFVSEPEPMLVNPPPAMATEVVELPATRPSPAPPQPPFLPPAALPYSRAEAAPLPREEKSQALEVGLAMLWDLAESETGVIQTGRGALASGHAASAEGESPKAEPRASRPGTPTALAASPSPPLEERAGVRTPQGESLRFEPPNFNGAGGFSLASFGGEGWGEEAPGLQSIRSFMGRMFPVANQTGGSWGGVPAAYKFNPKPKYPAAARRRKEEGLVVLGVELSRAGVPERIQVLQSSTFQALDEAAVKALRDWRFAPARRGGVAVTSQLEVPVRFKLSSASLTTKETTALTAAAGGGMGRILGFRLSE